MIPIDRANPDKPYGPTSYGQISPNASTLFNFDIPASDAGRSCKVFFSMPPQSMLQNAQAGGYYFTGDGSVLFSRMGTLATSGTTYNDVALGRIERRDLGALVVMPLALASAICLPSLLAGTHAWSTTKKDHRYL
ncbi:hypothetical protein LQW54_006606 [Pestalotiopsis sp. IQ-011]